MFGSGPGPQFSILFWVWKAGAPTASPLCTLSCQLPDKGSAYFITPHCSETNGAGVFWLSVNFFVFFGKIKWVI